ncbi:MAG: YggT family protein [Holosporaceae bacterium]|jgi:uncharacterized protein YggT (Ycf19 family)|nr:YggT family protein [Holosporaceae bacterium]
MDILFVPLLLLFKGILGLALVVVVADVILGWLLVANILNSGNQVLYVLISSISRVANLMLQPIRRKIPTTAGAIDFSPVVLMLLLVFFERVTDRILIRFL